MLIAIKCEPLPLTDDGEIAYAPNDETNFALETVATYSCSTGFILDTSGGGSETRTCMDDGNSDAVGKFTGQAPICIREFNCMKLLKFVNNNQ